MYTVDASVWVNAFDQREPGHLISRQFLEVVRSRALPIIVPNVVLAEVAGAISRTRHEPEQAQAFATALSQLPHVTIRVLDEVCALHALTLAAQYGLRGADAVYAAVAREAEGTLVTLDNEHLTRLGNLMAVCTPAVALSLLTPPSQPNPG
jgi:predicted nucleic acid-binding protein